MTTIIVSSGQVYSSMTIGAGETLTVMNGGTAADIIVSQGSVIVSGGGRIESSVAEAGGDIVVQSGGFASSASLVRNGKLFVSAGGSAYATQVISGRETVRGYDSGAVVTGAGVQDVFSGGVVSDAMVVSGATELVSGGSANFKMISAGATLDLSAGVVDGSRLIEATAIVTGGTFSNSQLDLGTLSLMGSGAVAESDTISEGETLTLGDGARAIGLAMDGGVTSTLVLSGGVLSDTQDFASVIMVENGGSAVGGTDYASMVVYAGGSASDFSVANEGFRGVLVELPGASVTNITVDRGGA